MRKVLVVALGALALAGCVHHDGAYRGAGYGYGSYGYAYNAGYGYRPVHAYPTDWERRAYWRAREERRERWRYRWAYHD